MYKDEPTEEDFLKIGNPDYEELKSTIKEGINNGRAGSTSDGIISFTNIFMEKKTLTKEEVYIQMISWLGEIYTNEFDRNK